MLRRRLSGIVFRRSNVVSHTIVREWLLVARSLFPFFFTAAAFRRRVPRDFSAS